jgi:transcriptional regulator with XRE-family HTH domain
MENIGKTIRSIRKKKKVSQEDLVKKLGITVQTLSKIENDKGKVHTELLDKICQVLGVELVEFFELSSGVDASKNGLQPVPIHGYVNDLSRKHIVSWTPEGKPESDSIGVLNVSTQLSDKNSYAMIVSDNSMDPIESGWVIIVSPFAEIQNRDLVMVDLYGEALLRRISINDNDSFTLHVTKSFQRPKNFTHKDVAILHKVIGFMAPHAGYIKLFK